MDECKIINETQCSELEATYFEIENCAHDFTNKVKRIIKHTYTDGPKPKISLVFHEESEKKLEKVIFLIEKALERASLEKKRIRLQTKLTKEELKQEAKKMKENGEVAVVLVSQEMSQVEGIKEMWEEFIENNSVDSLHMMNCEEKFEVALKVVDKSQMIRSLWTLIRNPKEGEEIEMILSYWDIFWAIRGSQGLGLIADILDLEKEGREKDMEEYEEGWRELQEKLVEIRSIRKMRDFIIFKELRENKEEEEEEEEGNEKTRKEKEKEKEKEEEINNIEKDWREIEKSIENMYEKEKRNEKEESGRLKYLIILCDQGIRQEKLGRKILTKVIEKTKERQEVVIWIRGNQETNPNKMIEQIYEKEFGAKSKDMLQCSHKRTITLIIEEYQELESYENLISRNGLNQWKTNKIIVLCEKRFFKHKRWQSSFFERSNREEKKRSRVINLKNNKLKKREEEEEEVKKVMRENKKLEQRRIKIDDDNQQMRKEIIKKGVLIELTKKLERIEEIWRKILIEKKGKKKQWFISYAWQDKRDEDYKEMSLLDQQGILIEIVKMISKVGTSVWLDINQMTGNINEQMSQNIRKSEGVIMIGTPKYLERAAQNQKEKTNVRKEVEAINEKLKSNSLSLIILDFIGNESNQQNMKIKYYKQILNLDPINENKKLKERVDFEDFRDVVKEVRQGEWKKFGEKIFELLHKIVIQMNKTDNDNNNDNDDDDDGKELLNIINYESKRFCEEIEEKLILNHLLIDKAQEQFRLNDFESRLEGYIEARGLHSRNDPVTSSFELWPKIEDFLEGTQKKCLVILGESGSGKSLFAGRLLKRFLEQDFLKQSTDQKLKKDEKEKEKEKENKKKKRNIPIYIRLQEFANRKDEELRNSIELILREQNELKEREMNLLKKKPKIEEEEEENRIVVIMDGYDEIGGGGGEGEGEGERTKQELGRFVNVCSQLRDYERDIKMIVIGRTEYFDSSEITVDELLRERDNEKSEIVYMSPFNYHDVITYCKNYERKNKTKINQNQNQERRGDKKEEEEEEEEEGGRMYKRLEKIDGMTEMMKNPFTLSAILQSIDRLEEKRRNEERKGKVLRLEVYESFVEEWISQEREGNEEIKEHECLRKCEKIAREMFRENRLLISQEKLNKQENSEDEQEKEEKIIEMIPIRWTGREGTFVHKSVFEYFLSRLFVQEIRNHHHNNNSDNDNDNDNDESWKMWKSRVLSRDERSVMLFIGDFIRLERQSKGISCWETEQSSDNRENLTLQQILIEKLLKQKVDLNLINNEEENEGKSIGGNIMSVLNYSGFNFSGMDLSQLNIPGSDLQNSNLNQTNLKETILCSKVLGRFAITKLNQSMMNQAILDRSKMGIKNGDEIIDCEFGESPDLIGHTKEVVSVDFSPDGKKIVSGSKDKTIRIWDALSGNCEHILKGHTNEVKRVAFSPDGKKVYSRSQDKTIRIWDALSGNCETTLQTNVKYVESSVIFSPDGKKIAWSDDKTIQIYDILSGNCEITLKGHSSSVNSIDFSRDGKKIVSGSVDETIRIWDTLSGNCEATLKGHSREIVSIAFSRDGKKIVSGSSDETIRIWDTLSGNCEHVLQGHLDIVTCISLSPDGKKIASSSYDETIRIWDSLSGNCETTFQGHSSFVTSVAFSPDGKKIISGSWDKTIRIWETLPIAIQGHTDTVSSTAFSPDGKKIASGSWDKTIRIWDTLSGNCEATLRGHTENVSSVAFSSDGKKIVSGSWDKTIRIWDTLSGNCEATLRGHTEKVECVAISTDGKKIVSGSSFDNNIRIWDTLSGKCESILKGHTQDVKSVAFSPKGDMIASGSNDNTVRIWDPLTLTCEIVLEGHEYVYSVAFSPDGEKIVSGSSDNTIRIWDISYGECENILSGHQDYVFCIGVSADGKRIVSGSCDKTIKIWDVLSGNCEITLRGHSDIVNSVAFSPDGKKIVSGSTDKTMRIWNTSYEGCKTLQDHTDSVFSIAFSPDGKKIASGSNDSTIRIWDTLSGTCENILQDHTRSVFSVAFSPDGKKIVSGSIDKTIRIWETLSGKCETTLQIDNGYASNVVFSPDGKLIASGLSAGTIQIYDTLSGICKTTLEGHTHPINSVVFSPNGKKIVSGSDDKTIRIWDVLSGECETILEEHYESVISVAFSPDGKKIVSGSSDETIRVWDVLSGECETVLYGNGIQEVLCVVFSPDGKKIVSGSSDETIRIWDIYDGNCKTLQGHTEPVKSLAFSSDGKMFASGSFDQTIRIFKSDSDGNIKQKNPRMLWCGGSHILSCLECSSNGIKNLSESKAKLVSQRGAYFS